MPNQLTPPTGTRICAWCGDILERHVPGLSGPSHGICKGCEREHFPGLPTRPSGADAVPGLTSNIGAIAAEMGSWPQ